MKAGPGLRGQIRGNSGFTLLETCVIILVLAALVAVAIPVIGSVSREAEEIVEEVNYRTVCVEMDDVWHEITGCGGDRYVDPDTGEAVDANYMEERLPTIDWYDFRAGPGAASAKAEPGRGTGEEADEREEAERKFKEEELIRRWPDFEELPESVFGSVLLVTGTGLGPGNADHSRLMVMAICLDRSVLYTQYDRGFPESSGSFNYDDGPPDWHKLPR